MFLKIFFYDKIKNSFMPYDTKKYKGFDYFWRASISASICMGITTIFAYPFDLVHTRMVTDLTKKGQSRLFYTTFDCLNRTHIDEGRKGLYKGFELAIATSLLRASFTLPIYDTLRHTGYFNKREKETLMGNFLSKLGPSFITSILLSTLMYPLDTLKRCMQLNGGRG